MDNKKKLIINKALNLGFETIGFTEPKISLKDQNNYNKFLENSLFGQMKWLVRHATKKKNPKNLWSKVETILVLGLNYAPEKNPLNKNLFKEIGNVSVYASNKDYHNVIKKKLLFLKQWLKSELNIDSKYFVDSAPVFEKPLAQSSGVGWQGKHTNLVSKKFGSWLFLCEIFLPTKLKYDKKEIDHCGSCNDCIDICPTNAFLDSYRIDARKCISYLTIEHKGPFPLSLREKIGNKIYGCDDCLAICPWNKFKKNTVHKEFIKEKENENYKIFDLLNLTEDQFKEKFKESPILRIGWKQFMRNVLIAAANSNDRKFISKIKKLLSNRDALIRGTAIWSLGKLMNDKEKKKIKKSNIFDLEKNKYVLFEWQLFKTL